MCIRYSPHTPQQPSDNTAARAEGVECGADPTRSLNNHHAGCGSGVDQALQGARVRGARSISGLDGAADGAADDAGCGSGCCVQRLSDAGSDGTHFSYM